MNTDAHSGIWKSNPDANILGRTLSPIFKTLDSRELRGIPCAGRCLRRQVRAVQRHSQHKDYFAFMLAAHSVFCEMPWGIEWHSKQEWGLETPCVGRTMPRRRSAGGCCEAEATHTPASPSPREGERKDLAPQVCCLQPLPSPDTWKDVSETRGFLAKLHGFAQSQPWPTGEGQKPLLAGERMFRDGSWLGVCSTRGCMAVDMCPGSHQDHVNTLAYGEVMPNRDATETPKCWCCCCWRKYLQWLLISPCSLRGKNVAGACWGLRCDPRLSRRWWWWEGRWRAPPLWPHPGADRPPSQAPSRASCLGSESKITIGNGE